MPEDGIQFSFELIDNVSESAEQISRSSQEASEDIDALDSTASRADSTVKSLDSTLQANQMQMLTQMAILGSLGGAVSAINGGLQTLGIVGDETAQHLNKVVAAFNLIKGSAQSLVAVKAILATLNAQEAINASITTYLAALKNPALLVGVGLAGGAALAVAGQYLTNNSNTTNNMTTNITVQDTTPKGATDAFVTLTRVTEGGAL